jgi:hypothetical protein
MLNSSNWDQALTNTNLSLTDYTKVYVCMWENSLTQTTAIENLNFFWNLRFRRACGLPYGSDVLFHSLTDTCSWLASFEPLITEIHWMVWLVCQCPLLTVPCDCQKWIHNEGLEDHVLHWGHTSTWPPKGTSLGEYTAIEQSSFKIGSAIRSVIPPTKTKKHLFSL